MKGIQTSNYSQYQPVKILKRSTTTPFYFVGLFKDKKNKQVIIRNLTYTFNSLRSKLFLNEAKLLLVLNKISEKKNKFITIKFPKLYSVSNANHEITIIREYIEGKNLKQYNKEFIATTLKEIIFSLKLLLRKSEKNLFTHIEKRTSFHTFVLFPLYLLTVVLKDTKNIFIYLKLSYIFYQNFMLSELVNTRYVLSHRDLISENILIKNNKIYIIDFEISLLAEEETDIALISLFYTKTLGIKTMNILLHDVLQTKKQIKNFARLSSFYLLQLLAKTRRNDERYKNGIGYANLFLNDMANKI